MRHLHVAEKHGDPGISGMVRLEQVMRGIKSTQARGGLRGAVRLPVTLDILRKLKAVWTESEPHRDGVMLWAAAALCFFAFLRAGEMTVPSDTAYDQGAHLSFEDVAADSLERAEVIRVRIKASKTDPFRVGVDVFIGKTGDELCPVTAILTYMVARGGRQGPLFVFRDGKSLTRPIFVGEVKAALGKAGIDHTGYSGHSFRSGAATTAAAKGIRDSAIKMLGRWKSEAYQLYIKTPRDQLAAVSRQLVKQNPHVVT